jgi:hypothetical protein
MAFWDQLLQGQGGFHTGAVNAQKPYYSFDFDKNVRGFNGQEAWDAYYTANGNENAGRTDSQRQFAGADGQQLVTYLDREGNYIVATSMDLGGQFFGKQASKLNGTGWDRYSKDGKYLGSGQYEGLKDSTAAPWMGAGMALGGIGATMYGLGGAAAAGAGAAEGAGAGVAGAGEIAAGNGAFLGEGVASGIGGWDAAAWAAAGGSPLAAGAAGAGLGAGAGAGAGAGTAATAAGAGLGTLGTLGTIAGIAAPIIGGAINSSATGKAADAQLQATREAAALQEPFRQGGMKGLNRLLDLYGLSGNTGAEGYGSAQKKFGMSDFQADPGYQFRQQEGEKAMQRAASAAGGLGSGKFLKDAMRFSQGLASDEYGRAYDRYGTDIARQINPLQALAGQGQSAANTIGDYRTQGGNAQAAGRIGQANAWSNALTQGMGWYQNNQQQQQTNALLNRFIGS